MHENMHACENDQLKTVLLQYMRMMLRAQSSSGTSKPRAIWLNHSLRKWKNDRQPFSDAAGGSKTRHKLLLRPYSWLALLGRVNMRSSRKLGSQNFKRYWMTQLPYLLSYKTNFFGRRRIFVAAQRHKLRGICRASEPADSIPLLTQALYFVIFVFTNEKTTGSGACKINSDNYRMKAAEEIQTGKLQIQAWISLLRFFKRNNHNKRLQAIR